jgi:hypothetical protein
MLSPLDLVKFVKSYSTNPQEQLQHLAALADAPGEDFESKIKLPMQRDIPAFNLGDGSLGSVLADQEYAVPAPVPGQENAQVPSVGELLVGEIDG